MTTNEDTVMVPEAASFGNSDSTNDRLLLGIDLGTSQTAVVSSRGHKALLPSVVGYPKDLIGLKLLGQPFCVGTKAFEMRSVLDLFYPLQDGVLREYLQKDIETAGHLISHAVAQAQPRQVDKVCAIIGVPARASAANKDLLLKIAQESVDLALVVSEPFMVAYGINELDRSIVVDIGAGTLDICALKGAVPGSEDQVTLAKAGNFVDERLKTMILERYPDVQINEKVACEIKEKHSFVGATEDPVRVEMRAGGKPVVHDVSEQVRRACEALTSDIVENVVALIQGFPPEDQATALQNIVIAGGGSRIRGLDQFVTDKLTDFGDVRVTCVEDPTFAGAEGALKLAQELPLKYWGKLGDITAAAA